MDTKEKIKKFFAVALIGYLAVNAIYAFFSLVNHIVDAASNYYTTFSVTSALQFIFNMLAFLAMLLLVASVAVEAFKGIRSFMQKLWFLPAILRCVSVFVSLISFCISLRYLHGAWNWISTLFMEFLWLIETVLYLAACWLLFPKALFVYEVEPVFKKKAPAAPAYGYAPYGQPNAYGPQAPYGQQPYAAPQQAPYGQQPYAQQPYAQQPYAQQPYAQQPYPQQPYAQQPYAAPQQDPYAQQPYAAPQDPSAPNGPYNG